MYSADEETKNTELAADASKKIHTETADYSVKNTSIAGCTSNDGLKGATP